MTDRPGRLDDADERLLASLVAGNLLVVRQVGEMADDADLEAAAAEDRIAGLVDEGLLAEITPGRYTITDEGFEHLVESMDLDALTG